MVRPKKIFYFTNIFPSYRKELWKALLSLRKIDFNIFFSNEDLHDIRTTSLDSFTKAEINKLNSIKNLNFMGHLFWQIGILRKLLSSEYDSAIFLGDIKIISNWLGIIICKLRGKVIGLWTHGVYGNENFFKKKLRLFFFTLADNIFLYENRAKKILVYNGFPEERLHVIFNSINLNEQTKVYNKLKSKSSIIYKKKFNIIFFGRLTKIKKVDMAIKAIISINQNNEKYELKIIGDGPEKESLKNIVISAKAEKYIFFEKAKYDEIEIGKMFFESDLLISPGNVGLNAIHAMCYGTPVLTHNNFNNQMPECESIKEGFNGLLHKENDIISIQNKIELWFSKNFKTWERDKIRNQLIKKYNPQNQAKIFEIVLKG